jgi:hypothetical protein
MLYYLFDVMLVDEGNAAIEIKEGRQRNYYNKQF